MPKLPNKEFRAMVPLLREEGFYESEEPRKIHWPEYSLSQIEDAQETLDFIRKSVDKTNYYILKGKVGRPLNDPKDLAKAILVCELLGLTERKAQGWLKILGPYLGIENELDDKTISDAYDKIEVLFILKQVFNESKTSDGELSGDGTGLETTRKQNYESTKKCCLYMTSIVDNREIVQAFDISGLHECKAMHNLVKEVEGNSIRLDAGFVDRKLTEKICDRDMIHYIFPKSNINQNGKMSWKLMYLELYYDVMGWLTEYHKRSHTESFHSSFKRVMGIIRKRRPMCQLNQVTARVILHNRRRMAYFSKLAQAS